MPPRRAISDVTDAGTVAITGTLSLGTPTLRSGTGSPEGVVTATVGSLFLRTDGGTGTVLYRKETGTGNTGWVATAGGGASIETVSNPVALGTAAPGSGTTASAYNHVHPTTGLATDSLVVHLAGAENVTGVKTFTNGLVSSGGSFQVDSAGRVGILGAVSSDSLVGLGSFTPPNHPGTSSTLYGLLSYFKFPSTTTAAGYVDYSAFQTVAGSFTVSEGVVKYIAAPILGASSAVTTLSGIFIGNQGQAGVANAYGINVTGQTGATSTNHGVIVGSCTTQTLWLAAGDNAATTAAKGIAFGDQRDTKLYRSAASTLKTDGDLTAGSLSTVGAVTGGTVNVNTLLNMTDAINMALGTGTGTKIGTGTTQKLGFYNSTPVVQPAGTTDVLASLVTLGLRAASSNPPLDLGTGTLTAGIVNPATGFRINNAAASGNVLKGDGTNFISGRPTVPSTSATRTSGNLVMNQASTTAWNNLDTGLDLTLAAVSGDIIEVSISGRSLGTETPVVAIDVGTLVSGSIVNYFGTAGGTGDFGITSWILNSLAITNIGPSVPRTLVSGDVSGGNVVLRLRYRIDTASSNKTLQAGAAVPLKFSAKNLGQ